jgi:hypothetical protein
VRPGSVTQVIERLVQFGLGFGHGSVYAADLGLVAKTGAVGLCLSLMHSGFIYHHLGDPF